MVHPVFWTDPWAVGYPATRGLGGSRATAVRVVDEEPQVAEARPARRARVARRAVPGESEADRQWAAWDASTASPAAAPGPRAPGAQGTQEGPVLPHPDASAAPDHVGAAGPERERWREALRELEAAKERALREAERAQQEARAELVRKLLPVLDGLDRSLASETATSGLVEGVKLVRAQLAQVLSDFGVDRIDAVGRVFDPKEHEAVDIVAVDTPSDHHRVVEQWEAGYRHAGRVLRPAKVRVGKFSG